MLEDGDDYVLDYGRRLSNLLDAITAESDALVAAPDPAPRRASLTGMATQANRPDRIERRRQSAKDRHTAREALTAAEQIRRLDDHLGAGVGATKERARLAS